MTAKRSNQISNAAAASHIGEIGEFSSMTQVTEREVLDRLRSIVDPRESKDIVSLGMVSGVVVRDGNVGFSIEVPPERGGEMEPVRKAAEGAVHAIAGVVSVTAVLTAHRPAAPSPQRPPQHQHAGRGAQQPLAPGVRFIVAVASGKGGVGKSTTAVNIALALATAGRKVGLLDADIYGPSQPRMMGITGRPRSTDGKILEPMENYGIKVMSMGFLVDEETPMIWRGPMVMSALQQMLRDVNWGELDVMIVDMPPGTGDAQLTMAQQVPLAGAVIVSTPQDIALLDARKGLNMFRKVDVPVLGIIENMSYFLCPNCGHQADIFGHGGARAEAVRLGIEFLGEIPLHLDIRETSDGGQPIVVSRPETDHAAVYRAIGNRIWEQLTAGAGAPARPAPRIVIQ
jgi:ATP-binding protein involved in chromosome partitioning